jgi:hypothetical protein
VDDRHGVQCAVAGSSQHRLATTLRQLTVSGRSEATQAVLHVTVTPEDATVRFHGGNPVAVRVPTAGGASGAFELTVRVIETEPDAAAGTAAPGDVGQAQATMRLVPVGAGSAVPSTVPCRTRASGTGYDGELTVTCGFDRVPVNTYAVETVVAGGRYAGQGTDVTVVYDPSLGYTSGGGRFTWPGTEDVVQLGYTMAYSRKGTSVKGALLLIRHAEDGDFEVRSNSLYGLALGNGTATFAGKATYLEPGWVTRQGNHEFTVYVEDNETTGDRFWLQVRDQSRATIAVMSMLAPGVDHAVRLDEGDLFAPRK